MAASPVPGALRDKSLARRHVFDPIGFMRMFLFVNGKSA